MSAASVNEMIDRLRGAGLRGSLLGDLHRKGMTYGPYYIYKTVKRLEMEALVKA